MNVTTRQLEAFLAVARLGSITRASEELFLTQAGLSLMLKSLEDQVGARLFDRTTRTVRITPAGESLLPSVRTMLDHLGQLLSTPGPTAAVYLELKNEGSEPERLTGASTQLAERIEFHEHRSSAGVMSMAAVPEIVLPPHTTVRLAPGKVHLMLFGLERPLKPGDRFPLALRFERAGEVEVEALTGAAGALEPPHDLD